MPKRHDPQTGRRDYYRKASSGTLPGGHTHPPADIIPQGAGSLLDADLLDGHSSADFLPPVTSVFGRTGAVVAGINDYTWAQIDKTISSLADLTTKSHTVLSDIGTNAHSVIDTHLAASAPHSGHEVTSAKGAVSGYCPLDASALVPDANIPSAICRDSELTTHAGLSSGVHGVGASTIESVLGSQGKVDTHAALTTGVHGAGASTLATIANIATHAALTTSVHNFDASGNAPPQAHAHAAGDITSGTLAVLRGGTGQTTEQLAINALSAVAGATNEHVLTKDTATGNAIFKAVAGGGVTGSGAAGQVSFWTGASAVGGDNDLWWDNVNKRFGVGTTSPVANAVAHIDGSLAFTIGPNTRPVSTDHIESAVDGSAIPTFFIRAKQQCWIALDYDNDDAAAGFRIYRDSVAAGITLFQVDQNAICASGQVGVPGGFAVNAQALGGYAVSLSSVGSPTLTSNRLHLANTTVSGSGICHLSLEHGFLLWNPTETIATVDDFWAGTRGALIGQYISAGVERLAYESLCSHDFVLDSDNDEADSSFNILRHGHAGSAYSAAYWPASGWYGEVCFSVSERGVVYTPAWKIHRKAISAAYTLDTWQNFDGCDDLLLEVTAPPGGLTITLPAAGAANNARLIIVKDVAGTAATRPISVSENVDGVSGTSLINVAYGVRHLYSNGSGWYSASAKSTPLSYSHYKGGITRGSTNTNIVCYSTLVAAAGASLTYTSDAVNGDGWTVNVAGVYTISVCHVGAVASPQIEICIGAALNNTMDSVDSMMDVSAPYAYTSLSPSWTGYIAATKVIFVRSLQAPGGNVLKNEIAIARIS